MDALWHDLLHPDVSILEKILRPILVYLFLIVSLRLAGKRELAQLNPFDLVVLMTLSNTVQVHGCHHGYGHDLSGWHRHSKECRTTRGVVDRKKRGAAKS